MPNPCEYIYESITCTAVTSPVQTGSISEYIDTVNLFTPRSYAIMLEHAGTAVTVTPKLRPHQAMIESIEFETEYNIKFKIPVMAESVACTDLFGQKRTFAMAESIGLTQIVLPKVTHKYTMAEAITTVDRFFSGAKVSVSETIGVADTQFPHRYIRYTMAETANAADTMPNQYVRFRTSLSETVGFTNVFGSRTVQHAAVSESVSMADLYWFRSSEQIAWQMNTETTALSWNTNYMFDSVAQYGDVVLAAAPDGVYLLSGNTDQTVEIDASVRTGFMDFDNKNIKRMGGVFFGLRGSSLKLALEPFGAVAPSEYTMIAKTTVSPGSNRIIPGKGLASRYWRMTFSNVDGGDFDIDNIELDVASSTTRRL